MKFSANFLIQKRKEKWTETHDIEFDRKLRTAIAKKIIEDSELREEITRNPEKVIELLFVVVDKNQTTMPFFLNEVQREFIDILNDTIDKFNNSLISDISLLILKGRQQGFTTLVTAYQEACSITKRNFQGFTLADKAENAETIFENKAKFTFNQLPEIIKPTEKFNNKRQLLFDKLNSSWSVDTATKDVGRSRTINFFHGSECAFWKDGIATIQAGLGEAFTLNCIKIYESTANGYNDWQEMWSSGSHINCFFAWWKTSEYRIHIPSKQIEDEFISDIEKKQDWIYERLKWLRDVKKLDNEQLYWYFKKYEKYIDKELIKQEYPCSPDEAFLLPGQNAFNTTNIMNRLDVLKKPLKVGYFTYNYDDTKPEGKKISSIKWVNDPNGYIQIYKVPQSPKITKYCIGGDTAGDGSDFYTGHVLDARTGEQVAHLKHKLGAHQYVRQMYCLGKYYSYHLGNINEDALIGIETNFDTFPIMELQRLGYTNQYIREKFDEYTGKKEKRFGFRTTSLTRPVIISQLQQIVDEEIDKINDESTLRELLKIIKNKDGRIEAPSGGHDDDMMGLSIAHHIRLQVCFTEDIFSPYPEFREFNVEDSRKDYGEKIVIV